MIIDFHSHFVPAAIVGRSVQPGGHSAVTYVRGVPAQTMHPLLGDMAGRLGDMGLAGIDAAVLSAPLPAASLEDCRLINDDLHRLAGAHRGRLFPLAHVPALGGSEALAELERCARELGCKGVLLWSDVGGEPLDGRALWPFYERVAALGLFVFIHPTLLPLGADFMAEHDLARMAGREFGLVLCMLRLAIGGVLDAFPTVPFCLSHCAGGAVPLVGRFEGYLDRDLMGTVGDPRQGTRPARPLWDYVGEFYYDTGGFFGDLTAVEATLLRVPVSHMLFGTDYPQEIRTGAGKRDFVRAIQGMRLSAGDREAILGGNAARLLGL
jgi:predicted TIM-barrel fold metal-dependent hydrolase